MTASNQTSKRLTFVQIIVPVLLSFVVFLLGIIAWGGKSFYSDYKKEHEVQQQINLQVLENLGTINANCIKYDDEMKDLKFNDRRQDLILEQHETRLKYLK